MAKVIHLDDVRTSERFERVALGRRGKKRRVEVLLPGLLLKGQSHLFYGASDTGKSWIAKHASRETMREGMPVIYMDKENGPDVVEERMLDALEVSQDDIDDYFNYFPFLDLTLDRESRGWFTSLLDSFPAPGLVVWDSLLGHMSECGLKENESDDFEKWAGFFLDKPRARGWTSMVLDHTGHDGSHPRGTSRKDQSVQVAFKVSKKEKFDRTRAGRLKLTNEKDRTASLPGDVDVRLGNTPFELAVRYDGQEFMSEDANDALRLLPKNGSRHKDWKGLYTATTGKSGSSFDRAIRELKGKQVESEDGLYVRI